MILPVIAFRSAAEYMSSKSSRVQCGGQVFKERELEQRARASHLGHWGKHMCCEPWGKLRRIIHSSSHLHNNLRNGQKEERDLVRGPLIVFYAHSQHWVI